ncbi:MAG: nucleoside triphosphate pyrophosphohydrolase [Oscillospiraceae bacterium]
MNTDFQLKELYNIDDLLKIVALLRSENGCPWDKEQTHESIKNNLLEETYEAYEAIVLNDTKLLKEELGDVLLQVVFHAQIENEAGAFDFDGICNDICIKLVERHPHVFGDVTAETTDKVLENWEAIKKKQKNQTTATQTLQAVPTVFPALMKAQKVQKRAAKAGFDYPDTTRALNDLESEIQELKEAIESGEKVDMLDELGDVFFSAVNVARFIDVDAEQALTESTKKFITRFEKVEILADADGIDMKKSSIEQLDELWKQAKKKLNNQQ